MGRFVHEAACDPVRGTTGSSSGGITYAIAGPFRR
jgi:hypothetical protein